MKKILILGAQGMLGNCLFKLFQKNSDFELYGTARESGMNIYELNILNYEYISQLENILKQGEFSYVINAIGYSNKNTQKDSYEEICSKYILLNAHLPKILDALSQKYDYKLIHVSTNGVFNGDIPHSDLDVPDSIGWYGISKFLGEVNSQKNLTIRTSIIGIEIGNNTKSLLSWFLSLPSETEISGYKKVLWNGITTLMLAKILEKIISDDIPLSGIVHITGEKISKFDLLNICNKLFLKNIQIREKQDIVSDNTLTSSTEQSYFQNIILPLEKQIQELKLFYNL